jgi:CheY-like chemotaxis protein
LLHRSILGAEFLFSGKSDPLMVSNRFLVIDDSYIDRLVSGMLIRRTFDVTDVHEVNGGRQGLEWLQAHKVTAANPLIILLDIMMPQMNGFEFLEQFDMLDQPLQNNTSIVMLSSTLDHDDIQRAKKHPSVKKLLSKPLSANELKEFLRS